jgi:hypothetical protein
LWIVFVFWWQAAILSNAYPHFSGATWGGFNNLVIGITGNVDGARQAGSQSLR